MSKTKNPKRTPTPTGNGKPAAQTQPAAQASPSPPPSTQPAYELRLVVPQKGGQRVEVWQLPSSATPRLTEPERVASLSGRGWRIAETRVLRRLAAANITFGTLTPGHRQNWPLQEELALNLGLLFRTLAPMRHLDRLRQVADAIEGMSREELGYWVGMVMHRRRPRRVMAALRMLLTDS